MRLDIQGIRCMAVLAVFVFHMFPLQLPNGFLGVDMFFSISGYLMFMLLFKKQATQATIVDFYYRRIKRIFPLYLTIIILTQLYGKVYMNVDDRRELAKSAGVSSIFCSNFLNLPSTGYFTQVTKTNFLLHTWSLSVEIQFYLIVPLVMAILQRCRRLSYVVYFGVQAVVIATSCVYQVFLGHSDANGAHMSSFARIWQFFTGFLAFEHSLVIGLVTIVASHYMENFFKAVNKYITSWKSLLSLLAVLYSLIAFMAYLELRPTPPAMQTADNVMQLEGNTVIWPRPDNDFLSSPGYNITDAQARELERRAEFLFQHGKEISLNLSAEELRIMRMSLFNHMSHFKTCTDPSLKVATNYKLDIMKHMTWTCHAVGNGTKEIVIYGNSLARDIFTSMQYHFRHIYKHLTVISRGHCSPYLSKWSKVADWCDQACLEICHKVESEMLEVIRQWKRPIDILVVHHAYLDLSDHKLTKPIENDEFFQAMTDFYHNVSKLARDFVTVPYSHFMALKMHKYDEALYKEGVRNFTYPLKEHVDFSHDITARVDRLNCPKCLKLRLDGVFCRNETGFCHLTDNNGIPYFNDAFHNNYYGDLFLGQYFIDAYNEWVNEHGSRAKG